MHCNVEFGGDIDMGTNRVLVLVDLFFYSYVIPMRLRLFQRQNISAFKLALRYIDDVLSINV
jgi:hypothetical protein